MQRMFKVTSSFFTGLLYYDVREIGAQCTTRILDEQQQTEDECRQNAGDMDRIQTTACQSRHQGVPAAVCQHSISHHSIQSRCSSRQSAHHAGSCGGNVPLVFLSAEAAADHPEFIDNRCGQDVGTGVCRRSAWLLQQSTVRCQWRTPATSAECPERGSTVHHWYSEIRSHHASVAQPPLVASATKDNFQNRHSDVPMFEWTGAFLSGSRLHRSFCDTRSETAAICHLRAAVHSKNKNSDIWTEVIQGLRSNNLETIFPLGWKIHHWVLTHFENCLRHSCLINDCYMSAFAVPVLTCAEKCA